MEDTENSTTIKKSFETLLSHVHELDLPRALHRDPFYFFGGIFPTGAGGVTHFSSPPGPLPSPHQLFVQTEITVTPSHNHQYLCQYLPHVRCQELS